ncbi:MAG: c-type cytochrome [Phycisphaerales bacterium]|nr:c-type cytochrome [Phycisphaerales bacterium]
MILDPSSSSAARFSDVFTALMVFAGAIVLLVLGLVVVYCTRYRAGSGADRSGRLVHVGKLEALAIGAMAVTFGALFVWAAKLYFDNATPPADARTIYIVARQWMWKVEHPGGRREINELHIPIGEPVRLVMISQDVIHSFFIPRFRLKQDVLPTRYTTLWFVAYEPGEFHLFCSQYCGADHSQMRGTVVAMEPAEFQRWLGPSPMVPAPVPGTPGTPQGGLAAGGRSVFFALGCNACHVPGASVRAPRLDGIWDRPIALRNGQTVTGDEQYIRESILDPNAKISAGYTPPSLMPTYRGTVTPEQITQLIEFIKSLRDGWPPGLSPVQHPSQTGEKP